MDLLTEDHFHESYNPEKDDLGFHHRKILGKKLIINLKINSICIQVSKTKRELIISLHLCDQFFSKSLKKITEIGFI